MPRRWRTTTEEIRWCIRFCRRHGEFEAVLVPLTLRGARMEDRERKRKRKEREKMAKTLKASPVDRVAHALDEALRPGRERAEAERAQQAEEQEAERRRWGAVVAATLTELRAVAADLERWRQRGPVGGPLARDRWYSRLAHEAVDRVLAQAQGVEEMVRRDIAKLERWREELAGPMQPERFAIVIAGVREVAETRGAAASGLAASRTIRAQGAAQLAEGRAVYDADIRWLLDDDEATAATPGEAA